MIEGTSMSYEGIAESGLGMLAKSGRSSSFRLREPGQRRRFERPFQLEQRVLDAHTASWR